MPFPLFFYLASNIAVRCMFPFEWAESPKSKESDPE